MLASTIPHQTRIALFLRFLRLGALAVFDAALARLYPVRHELQELLVMGCAAAAGWLFF
ncbi:MAG: hypothetical protein ACKVXR_02990 [Planctomycetota bacterium]